MKIIFNEALNEKVYIEKLENGLEIIVVPKPGYVQKSVMFGTKYGSIHEKFIVPGETESTNVPEGIAHFLEHKLFEQPDGEDRLMKLMALGASPNAYTTSNHTVYFFNTIDNFDECTKILFDFVQNPYFTDENVQKEQGIIGQEIKRYEDFPESRLELAMLNGIYNEHTIKIDTAGTIESIAKINKELLYKCYNTFYDISNMVVCIAGDVNPEEMINKVKELVPEKSKYSSEIVKMFPQENDSIHLKYVEEIMSVNTPLFSLAYKDNVVKNMTNEQKIKRNVAVEIALELIIGKSTEAYQELYESGILIDELHKGYNFEEECGFVAIQGNVTDVESVINVIKNRITEVKNDIDEMSFTRIKKMLEGQYYSNFNNISRVCRMFFADYVIGINSLDYIETYANVNIDDIKAVLNELFIDELSTIAVIKGKE